MDAAATGSTSAISDIRPELLCHSAEAATPASTNASAWRKRAPAVVRALAVTALVTVSAAAASTGVAPADDVAAVASQRECLALGGNVRSGNVCRIYEEAPAYQSDLRFSTDYPDSGPVFDFVTQTRDQFLREAQSPGAPWLPYQLSIRSQTYRSGQPTRSYNELFQPWHGTQTLVLWVTRSTDPNIVNGTEFKTFTFDYDHNRPVTFDTLFAPGVNPVAAVYPALKTSLARQQFDRHFQLSPTLDPSHYHNFAIADDQVIFFFGVHDLPLSPETMPLFVPVSRGNLPPLQL